MAYNYFPATYPYYQPQIQQAQQYQPPQIIWISGEREAQMYPVAPNNAVTLWSQSEPVVYLKQADATGKPTLKIYDLVERAQTASNGVPATDSKVPAYATKNDLNAVLASVKGYDDAIGNIKAEIDALKSDMYGLAGKKKAKKQEADDE